MTKNEIKAEAAKAGYAARYSKGVWFFSRLWVSPNTRAFESVVLFNLKRRLGVG